jgi:hypothetical protein
MDLGLTPGTPIEVDRTGPFKDPRAYRIRGTVIALRSEQADHILVAPQEQSEDEPGDLPDAGRDEKADPA